MKKLILLLFLAIPLLLSGDLLVTGDAFISDSLTVETVITAEHFKSTDDVEVADDILMSDEGVIGIAGNERIIFDTAGDIAIMGADVGIGTTSPGAKLDVAGNINLGDVSTAERIIEIGKGRTGNGYSYIDLVGDTTYTDYGLRLLRGNTGANTWTEFKHRGTGAFYINANEAGSICLKTNNTNRLIVNADGTIGIGTTANELNVALHIKGSSGSTYIHIGDSRSTTGDNVGIKFGTWGGALSKSMIAHVETGSYGRGDLVFAVDPLADNANVDLTANEVMRIKHDGNVGIGEPSPSTILDVVAGSATDPVADAWDTHCGRDDQEIIKSDSKISKLDVIKSLPTYRYKKIAKLTESEKTALIDSTGKRMSTRGDSLIAWKKNLPKFTTERIGIMMDDPEVPSEILTFDKDGNKTGISLVGWLGYLTEALKEAGNKIDELEDRIEILEGE